MSRSSNGRPSTVGARAAALLLACIGVTLALAALARSAAGPAPTFAVAMSYPTGRTPGGVVVGDVNGDGKPDVASANPYGERGTTVSVFLNRGDGKLGNRSEYRVGIHPQEARLVDLNGDGRPDIAAHEDGRNGGVAVVLNRGDGTFGRVRRYPTPGIVEHFAIGDLNGDGLPDIATANEEANTVSVLLNVGDGTFRPRKDYPTCKEPFELSIVDVNGDRKRDLVTGGGRCVSVLLNGGDGTITRRRDYKETREVTITDLRLGDLNRDGAPDVVTGFDYSVVSVRLNRGDGSFRASRTYRLSAKLNFGGFTIADVNGDRKPDLLVDALWAASVLRNRGDGTFAPRRDYSVFPGCDSTSGRFVVCYTSIVVRDVNRDAKPDLVAGNEQRNAVYVSLNRGNGTFGAALGHATASQPIALEIADLNGDGREDVVSANYGSRTAGVLLAKPGLCNVQGVRKLALDQARQTLARANCRVATVSRARSKLKAGLVVSQEPQFGAVLPKGGKVNLVVSKGRLG